MLQPWLKCSSVRLTYCVGLVRIQVLDIWCRWFCLHSISITITSTLSASSTELLLPAPLVRGLSPSTVSFSSCHGVTGCSTGQPWRQRPLWTTTATLAASWASETCSRPTATTETTTEIGHLFKKPVDSVRDTAAMLVMTIIRWISRQWRCYEKCACAYQLIDGTLGAATLQRGFGKIRPSTRCLARQINTKKLVRCHEVGGIALTMCCKLKVRRLFSSLSREMLTFSRLIQHKTFPVADPIYTARISMMKCLWFSAGWNAMFARASDVNLRVVDNEFVPSIYIPLILSSSVHCSMYPWPIDIRDYIIITHSHNHLSDNNLYNNQLTLL